MLDVVVMHVPCFGLKVLVIEVVLVPIYVVLFSPFVLIWHVVKGIYGVWKTKSVSFYENPFEIQTPIFYSTMVSLFETITESLPQFLFQSWIYFHSKDLISESTYYISVGFSLLNIYKAIFIFIITRKELKFSTIRLANNITTEDDICEQWYDGSLILKLNKKKVAVIILLVQHYSNSNVQRFDVYDSDITDDGVEEILKHFRLLKSLNVGRTKISDNGLKFITENCHQLKSLHLFNTKVTNEGLKAIAANCQQLLHLSLSWTIISDAGLISVVKNCRQLGSLWLSYTSVTDDGLKAIAKNCLQLKTLDLEYTIVTDAGLKEIAENCFELESITLWDTKVTDSSVSLLLSNCKLLCQVTLPKNKFSNDLVNKYRRELSI